MADQAPATIGSMPAAAIARTIDSVGARPVTSVSTLFR
ncbi:hypothetical protein J2X65_004976 [Ancylobacter sp. 3268]|nr:hypothetical protein [Ancylobacter sp. 3268]